jgi:protocatechuate 3,4-dioxygenase beta subunit
MEDHDRGLEFDLQTMNRRNLLGLLVKAGMTVGLVGCGNSSVGQSDLTSTQERSSSSSSSSSASVTSANGACTTIPEETAGPYPGDGSNGPNALTASGVVRSDIRSSFNGLSGTATGIPMTVNLTLVNVNTDCSALAGYAIYLWHCDRDGHYSLYDLTAQNYLRGVQETDSTGRVTFTTIFPGCYSGRWPHMHFEVFRSLATATSSANKIKTSQIAMTSNASSQAYATSDYSSSRTNFQNISLNTDNVFSDGYSLQIPEITGDATNGYVLNLEIAISA